jgi:hypothetical protein
MTKQMSVEDQTEKFFPRDTAEHQLEVIRDDGLYKHLRFKKPGTGNYRFDIVTWPGYLTFCGDMGTLTFSREEDMLGFFRLRNRPDLPLSKRINPDYWSEKVQDGGTASCRRYSADVLRASILDALAQAPSWYGIEGDDLTGFTAAIEEQVLDTLSWGGENEVMEALRDFSFTAASGHPIRFEEWYEFARTEWDFRFLWACYGIVTLIDAYDAHVAANNEARSAADVAAGELVQARAEAAA